MELGKVETTVELIRELYIDLRKKVNRWAELTKQTAQARMGYVGQHLVSAATGYPGGKSGARGYDLILPDDKYGEIKTCYRVDQLGKCLECGAVVASIEKECSVCNSNKLKRMDDSKWLIGIRNQDEFDSILLPKYYYLVLFDFKDLSNPDTIRASIWQVNPTVPGFAFCMVDYNQNIRAKSKSKAPFNLWPFQLKFYLMKPELIYRSFIHSDDSIATELFPNVQKPILTRLEPLQKYARSQNLTKEKIIAITNSIGLRIDAEKAKSALLAKIQTALEKNIVAYELLVDTIACHLYLPDIFQHIDNLPDNLKASIKGIVQECRYPD
jgi:hypothetical protein